MTLKEINKQYEQIMKIKNSFLRDKKLAKLMTIMEYEFSIPIIKNIDWEKENKGIISLYRKISNSRFLS